MTLLHRSGWLASSWLLLVSSLGGCSATPHYVDNPTGDCEADGDGSRTGHNPGDSQYLPDCDPPLEREYYRVFAQEDETAYMIPRPDAMGIRYGYCSGDDAELADLFERNGLCVEVADPDVVNSMTPEDALAIAHLLHENLVFVAEQQHGESWGVLPGAMTDDVVAACDRAEVDLSDALDACRYHRDRASSKIHDDMGRIYTRAEAEQLAAGLNELYGIEP